MSPGNDSVFFPAFAGAIRDVHSHSLASLCFLIWDLVVNLDEEVYYVWTMRNTSPFKWGYFLLRYIVILTRAIGNVVSMAGPLANGSNPPVFCRAWHVYIIVSTQTISTLLELVLASRVYALYNRSRRVAFLLLTFILAEISWAVWLLSSEDDSDFHGTCLLRMVNLGSMLQCILGFSVHCAIAGLTALKYVLARKAGWGRTPLVSLVVRDNGTIYGTMFFELVVVVKFFNLENERAAAIYYWATSLASVWACHAILSMERFARKASIESPPDQLLFTSEITPEICGSEDVSP